MGNRFNIKSPLKQFLKVIMGLFLFLAEDVRCQSIAENMYDTQGRLTSDHNMGISLIEWNNFNKITRIVRYDTSHMPDLEFGYNTNGDRIYKLVKPRNGDGLFPKSEWIFTYYAYDANGVLNAVYDKRYEAVSPNEFREELSLIENKIQNGYRSIPIGQQSIQSRFTAVDATWSNPQPKGILKVSPDPDGYYATKEKLFELTNHRHDVVNVISDRKRLSPNSESFDADVVTTTDYDPFGMVMPQRKFLSNSHRNGMGSKEHDAEMKGDYNSYNYGARMYDPRLGRWLSIDPLVSKYPSASPYSYVYNNPIYLIDPDGNDIVVSDQFKKSKVLYSIFQLAQKNMIFDRLTKPFQHATRTLKVDMIHLPSNGRSIVYGRSFEPKGKTYSFSVNDIIFDTKGNPLPDPTIIFATLVHEGMHARNFYRQNSMDRYPGILDYFNVYGDGFYHHELMAAFNREELVMAMKEFDDQLRKIGENVPSHHTEDWYNAIAWGGLNKLYQDNNKTIYSDAWTNFVKRNPEKAQVYLDLLNTEREHTLNKLAPENKVEIKQVNEKEQGNKK